MGERTDGCERATETQRRLRVAAAVERWRRRLEQPCGVLRSHSRLSPLARSSSRPSFAESDTKVDDRTGGPASVIERTPGDLQLSFTCVRVRLAASDRDRSEPEVRQPDRRRSITRLRVSSRLQIPVGRLVEQIQITEREAHMEQSVRDVVGCGSPRTLGAGRSMRQSVLRDGAPAIARKRATFLLRAEFMTRQQRPAQRSVSRLRLRHARGVDRPHRSLNGSIEFRARQDEHPVTSKTVGEVHVDHRDHRPSELPRFSKPHFLAVTLDRPDQPAGIAARLVEKLRPCTSLREHPDVVHMVRRAELECGIPGLRGQRCVVTRSGRLEPAGSEMCDARHPQRCLGRRPAPLSSLFGQLQKVVQTIERETRIHQLSGDVGIKSDVVDVRRRTQRLTCVTTRSVDVGRVTVELGADAVMVRQVRQPFRSLDPRLGDEGDGFIRERDRCVDVAGSTEVLEPATEPCGLVVQGDRPGMVVNNTIDPPLAELDAGVEMRLQGSQVVELPIAVRQARHDKRLLRTRRRVPTSGLVDLDRTSHH